MDGEKNSRMGRLGKNIKDLVSVAGRSLEQVERLLALRTRITAGVPFVVPGQRYKTTLLKVKANRIGIGKVSGPVL